LFQALFIILGMTKEDLISPLLLAGIGLAFVFVSFMVWFSKGKSAKWVARKMKIGSILLSLTWFSCNYPPTKTAIPILSCYMIQLPVEHTITSVEIDSNGVIYGSLENYYDNLSYSIADTNGIILKREKIFARTYMSLPGSKEFIIQLDNNLKNEKCVFKLYECNPNEQDTTKEFFLQELNIIN
jgi:hypothetical protein